MRRTGCGYFLDVLVGKVMDSKADPHVHMSDLCTDELNCLREMTFNLQSSDQSVMSNKDLNSKH